MKTFGYLSDNTEICEYTLQNNNGMQVSAINLGGIIKSIVAPDRNGTFGNVVLSYNSLNKYIQDNCYIGAIIGRCANRIANGEFSIDNIKYFVVQNNNKNHLHGGLRGFNKVFWNIEYADLPEGKALKLSYNSFDKEENYPGNLNIVIYYILTDDNALIIRYNAETDKKTIVNLTNHSYFNLDIENNKTILNHDLQIFADKFLPIDENMIPTGILKDVFKTPFDFKNKKSIGIDLYSNDEQLKIAGGFDHCYAILKNNKPILIFSAESNGRRMEISTTEPGVHVYSGNFLNEKNSLISFEKNAGIAFETEHFPNAINQSIFPSVLLSPGEKYFSETKYAFSTF